MANSPATVLVVDDEPAIRRFLKSTLEVQGWAVVEAVDADAAIRAVRHHRPELILLDLGLPDRDGMALLPELKHLSDAAVLVLTSRDDERSKVAALDAGADDYVTKPFSIPELLARMRTALRHRVQEQGGRPVVQAGELAIDLVHRRVLAPARTSGSRPRSGTSWSSWRSTPAASSPTARSWPRSGAAPPRPSSNTYASTCASSARSWSPSRTARAGWLPRRA